MTFDVTPDIAVYKIAALQSNLVIITTKDIDFINYQNTVGAPPKIVYLNVGNISNEKLKHLIEHRFAEVIDLFLNTNTSLIEISTI